jgi:hypothetical protein
MKPKHILYGLTALTFILGYNYWLIQRDQKLFEAYPRPQQEVWR